MNAANPSGAWCQALETYDEACTSKGVSIIWEGKPGFEECGKKLTNKHAIISLQFTVNVTKMILVET
jgi:hypothetical protein